jgi:hypothetical protein
MKELNLSVSTGGEGKENTVVLTAKFATHDEAVAFHDGLARLCGNATRPLKRIWWLSEPPKSLPRPTMPRDTN